MSPFLVLNHILARTHDLSGLECAIQRSEIYVRVWMFSENTLYCFSK